MEEVLEEGEDEWGEGEKGKEGVDDFGQKGDDGTDANVSDIWFNCSKLISSSTKLGKVTLNPLQ